MTDKPIIFSGAMVRANLEDRKRQTRRITDLKGLRWAKGDRLWVRESCRAEELRMGVDGVRYVADSKFLPICNSAAAADQWLKLASYRQGGKRMKLPLPVPSIHMPRWCSRLTLLVTDVRVERLNDISERDAVAEGLINKGDHTWPVWTAGEGFGEHIEFPVGAFRELWEKINGDGSWDANPWVAVICYDLVKANIDSIGAEQ